MSKRLKTKYPGVFYREAKRVGGKGMEKVFYIVFKKNGKLYEEKVGRQYADDITPAKGASIRAERIEGKRLSRKELREAQKVEIDSKKNKWTCDRLWEEYKSQKPDSKSLRTDDGRYQNYIKQAFGNKEPKDLIQLDLDRLRINLLKKRKPQTVKHVLELLQRIINFGLRKGLCEGCGFKIEMPKVNNLKTEDLSPDQLNKLLNVLEKEINIQVANFIKMVLFTGMRRGELFKLKWKDIDSEKGFINIRDPKGGPDQKIPMNSECQGLLKNHPKTESEYVFPGRGGRQRTDIRKQVNRIKEMAGLPKDFRALHGLRHVYASMLASSGKVDMYTLQKLLTHKTPVMTQRYAHLRDEALRRASDLAGDIITKAIEGSSLENKKISLQSIKKS